MPFGKVVWLKEAIYVNLPGSTQICYRDRNVCYWSFVLGTNHGSLCFAKNVNARFCTTLKINKMNTLQHPDESEDSTPNELLLAYGRKVKELLAQSHAAIWVDELWDMYTGFTLFSQEAGYDPKGHDRFVSFKELVFFFQDVGKMKP